MSETPNHVPCRHCGEPISWDEICWTHDANGFADCDLRIFGGKPTDLGRSMTVYTNPMLLVVGPHKGKKAEPVGAWS